MKTNRKDVNGWKFNEEKDTLVGSNAFMENYRESSSWYSSIYNQEEKDINKTLQVLKKYAVK